VVSLSAEKELLFSITTTALDAFEKEELSVFFSSRLDITQFDTIIIINVKRTTMIQV
jgi:hypothetical protein